MDLFADTPAEVTPIETAEVTPDAAYQRTFYRADYRRFAELVQRARHTQGNRYSGKPPQQQAVGDQLVAAMVEVFAGDSAMADELPAKHAFDPDKFRAATQLSTYETG